MKVVVSMIARDELRRYQPLLTAHHLTWADEVRILDDGSRDRTGVVLQALNPPRVKVTAAADSLWDEHGEGYARQRLLAWTLAARADWVVQLDADEVIPDGERLRDWMAEAPEHVGVLALRMVEVWSLHAGPSTPPQLSDNTAMPSPGAWRNWGIRTDGEWRPRPVPICWRAPQGLGRLDRHHFGWEIPQRRLACGREPEIVRMLDATETDVDVCHLGWANPGERQARFDRYMRIDGGRYHDSAHLRSILDPAPRLERYPAPTLAVPLPH